MTIHGTSPSTPETGAYKVIGHSESVFFRTLGCVPIVGGIPSGIFEAVTAYRERKQDSTPITALRVFRAITVTVTGPLWGIADIIYDIYTHVRGSKLQRPPVPLLAPSAVPTPPSEVSPAPQNLGFGINLGTETKPATPQPAPSTLQPSPVSALRKEMREETDLPITGSGSLPTRIFRHPDHNGQAYICGKADKTFEEETAPDLYPSNGLPPKVTDEKGKQFDIKPGDYVVLVNLSDIQNVKKNFKEICPESVLLPGKCLRKLKRGDTFSFQYEGIPCRITFTQDKFPLLIQIIEEGLYPGGKGIQSSPSHMTGLAHTVQPESFPPPSEIERLEQLKATKRVVSIGTPESDIYKFKDGSFHPAKIDPMPPIVVYPLHYAIVGDKTGIKTSIRIDIPGATDFLLQLNRTELIVYRHTPAEPGINQSIRPEHMAAIFDLAELGIDPEKLKENLKNAIFKNGQLTLFISNQELR